jgi:hypothetical protein
VTKVEYLSGTVLIDVLFSFKLTNDHHLEINAFPFLVTSTVAKFIVAYWGIKSTKA